MELNHADIFHFYGRKPTSYEAHWEELLAQGMSEAICSVRANRPVGADWKRQVDEDFGKRGECV